MLRKKPTGQLIGYARVSTEDQNLQLQIDALVAAGVRREHIHVEKISGASKRRPGLDAAILDCNAGDVLVVWKLDRFSRSLFDLLTRLRRLQAAGVGFRSLTETIDTTTPIGQLLIVLIGGIAQFERDLTAERTRAGMKAFKARGGRAGPADKIGPEQYRTLLAMRDSGKSVGEIAAHYDVSRPTVYNAIRKARAAAKQRKK